MNDTYLWYEQLIKPSWAPPSWIFGPVWTVLYALVAISFGMVFYRVFKKELELRVIYPFILNLVFNAAFTPIQFGLKNNLGAAVDIVLVWLTLIWVMTIMWNKIRWAVWVNVPYFLWVSFATVLQFAVTYLNWGK